MKEGPDPSSTTDWVSAISSVIAVVFALVTVVTVYVAARQLLSERREYQMGLSIDALGPWHTRVKTRHLLGLQQQIATPAISVQGLLKQDWNPDLTIPAGFVGLEDGSRIDSERALAKASWVNFLQALGIQPADESLYRMQDQSALVNGIIPMRWAGKDLVSIGSILGFQSYEDNPSYKKPMPLPMQWIGPPGWLQFRQSPEGCVVEFRRRDCSRRAKELSNEIHEYYARLPRPREPHILRARLWWSVGAMLVKEDKGLFLGSIDDRRFRRGDPTMMLEKEADSDREATESDSLFSDLMTSQNPGVRTARWLETTRPGSGADNSHNGEPTGPWGPWGPWGPRSRRPPIPREDDGKSMVFYSSPGIHYSTFEGELVVTRGLRTEDCLEYSRTFVDNSKEFHDKFAYQLGYMRVDRTLLGLLKEAVALLKPDGYYFTPTNLLVKDVDGILGHVVRLLDRRHEDRRFRQFEMTDPNWPKLETHYDRRTLHHAMLLFNEIQTVQDYPFFPLGDIALFQKASYTLRGKGRAQPDLVWAMLVCPELYEDLAEFFHEMKCLGVLGNIVSCTGEVLDCTALMAANQTEDSGPIDNPRTYRVPLCEDGRFMGVELLAAFIDLTITAFWVQKRWPSNVRVYDALIPSTVTMC